MSKKAGPTSDELLAQFDDLSTQATAARPAKPSKPRSGGPAAAAKSSQTENDLLKDLGDLAQPGEQFYGINASNDGRVMIFAGGIPLERDGQVVGAVGVSGGTGVQDQAVAEAAASAF